MDVVVPAAGMPATDGRVLDELRALAQELEVPGTWELPGLDRPDGAAVIDRRLAFISRGRGALDLTIAELLRRLEDSGGRADLGFSRLGDYARERLDIAPRTALDFVRLARKLRKRPLLRAALMRGEITTRAAEEIAPVAVGADEAAWVSRGSRETVRALEQGVREVRAAEPEPEDAGKPWMEITASLGPDGGLLSRAILVGRVARGEGMAVPAHEILGDMCMDWLGSFPLHEEELRTDEEGMPVARALLEGVTFAEERRVREELEEIHGGWPFLEVPPAVPAPESELDAAVFPDEDALDAELVRLARVRRGWTQLMGHFGLLAQRCGVWRTAGFASFNHYCLERLGISPSTIRPHIAMERCFWDLPELREAIDQGVIGFEKAREIAAGATDRTVAGLIEAAAGLTCEQVRRKLRKEEEERMSGSGDVRLRVPPRIARMVGDARESMRRELRREVSLRECLLLLAEHHLRYWEKDFEARWKRSDRVARRDMGMCMVPWCSLPASEIHHIVFQSHGGGDEDSNRVCLCRFHHREGIHGGRIAAVGEAPDCIEWIRGRKAVLAWHTTRRGATAEQMAAMRGSVVLGVE